MRWWRGMGLASVLALGCAGCGSAGGPASQEPTAAEEVPVAERESIEDFDVPALDPASASPCALLPDEEARELGVLGADESGSPQTGTNCYFTDRGNATVDVRIPDEAPDGGAVRALTRSADSDASEAIEYVEVAGYPATTTRIAATSCNLDLAVSDRHTLLLQVTTEEKDACETALPVAEAVVSHIPGS